jgi:zinc protease
VIRTAPRAAFTDFYTRHYRPETTTLVVVGDFDPAAMEAKIRTRFGDWRSTAAAPTKPALGAVARRTPGETKLVVDAGAGLNIQLAWVGPPDLAPDTRAKRVADTPEAIGFAVLNRRLERLARAANPPFISASAGRSTEYDAAEITALNVTAEPDAWRRALQAVEQEQRRLVATACSSPRWTARSLNSGRPWSTRSRRRPLAGTPAWRPASSPRWTRTRCSPRRPSTSPSSTRR